MKIHQKGVANLLIVGIVVLVLAITGGVGYYFFKQNNNKKIENLATNVYTNKSMGIEFVYPLDITTNGVEYTKETKPAFDDCINGYLKYSCITSEASFEYIYDKPPFVSSLNEALDKGTSFCYAKFFVNIIEEPTSFSLEKMKSNSKKAEYINIDGVQGLRINEFNPMPPGGGGDEDMVYVTKDQKLYMISFSVDREDLGKYASECIEKQTDVFNQLLSTFKFTEDNQNEEQNNISQKEPQGAQTKSELIDWRKIFEFSYPKNFITEDTNQGVKIYFPESYNTKSYEYKNDVNGAWIGIGLGIMGEEGFGYDFCQKTSSDKLVKIIGETEINNISFIKSETSQHAMGGYYTDYTVYSTLYNGNCYDIVLGVDGKGPGSGANDGNGALPEDYANPSEKNDFVSILDQIISSFKFLQ